MTNPHSTEDNHTGRRIIKNVDLSHLSFIIYDTLNQNDVFRCKNDVAVCEY